MAKKKKTLWDNDNVQFTRLLAEVFMAGVTPQQLNDLSASMDLSKAEILEIFCRAQAAFDKLKAKL